MDPQNLSSSSSITIDTCISYRVQQISQSYFILLLMPLFIPTMPYLLEVTKKQNIFDTHTGTLNTLHKSMSWNADTNEANCSHYWSLRYTWLTHFQCNPLILLRARTFNLLNDPRIYIRPLVWIPEYVQSLMAINKRVFIYSRISPKVENIV